MISLLPDSQLTLKLLLLKPPFVQGYFLHIQLGLVPLLATLLVVYLFQLFPVSPDTCRQLLSECLVPALQVCKTFRLILLPLQAVTLVTLSPLLYLVVDG